MKKLWDYRVQVGEYQQHSNSIFLSFALETASPERALEIILNSNPFQDALGTKTTYHLTNFSGPNSFMWAE